MRFCKRPRAADHQLIGARPGSPGTAAAAGETQQRSDCVEKKNPFKFTLGFDKTKASHIRAVELLNSVKDKADLIAEAIVAHVDGIQESNTFSNEVLQAIIQETVRQEVHKAMQSNSMEKSEKEPEITMTFPEGTKDTIDPRVVENVRNAMSAFRRR